MVGVGIWTKVIQTNYNTRSSRKRQFD